MKKKSFLWPFKKKRKISNNNSLSLSVVFFDPRGGGVGAVDTYSYAGTYLFPQQALNSTSEKKRFVHGKVPELKRYLSWNRGVPMASRRGHIFAYGFLCHARFARAACHCFNSGAVALYAYTLKKQRERERERERERGRTRKKRERNIERTTP